MNTTHVQPPQQEDLTEVTHAAANVSIRAAYFRYISLIDFSGGHSTGRTKAFNLQIHSAI